MLIMGYNFDVKKLWTLCGAVSSLPLSPFPSPTPPPRHPSLLSSPHLTLYLGVGGGVGGLVQ